MNYVVLETSTKVSPRNLGMPCTPMIGTAFREMVTSYQSAKVFSLESFLLYGRSLAQCKQVAKKHSLNIINSICIYVCMLQPWSYLSSLRHDSRWLSPFIIFTSTHLVL